jgi:polysaccharide biosynthesis transport protein
MDGSGARARDQGAAAPSGARRPSPAAPRGEFLDLPDLVRMLRRRRGLILGTVAGVTLLALLVVFSVTPQYSAEALLLIDTRKTNVIDMEAVVSGLQPEAAAVRSEIDVLQSRELAGKVLDTLGLAGDPDFNTSLRGEEKLLGIVAPSRLAAWEEGVLAWLAGRGLIAPLPAAADLTPAERQLQLTSRLVDTLLAHLTVTNDSRSYSIRITYTAARPALAARIANAFADLYLVDQLDAKFEATKRANAWLNDRVIDLRAQLAAAERAVETYRAEHRIALTDVRGTTAATQQMAELNAQLALASADRAAKESRLRQFQQALRAGTAEAEAPEVLQSPLIGQLRAQETEVVRKEADLAAHYGARYPALIDVRAELRDVRRQIATEINKIVGSLAQEAQSARIREQTLQQNLAELQQRNNQNNVADVRLHELEREAQSNRVMYENFLTRLKETAEQEDIQQADARLIARAHVPLDPAFPKKKLLVALALLGSSALGVALAVLRERLDTGFRAVAQLETGAGLAGLGLVPAVAAGFGPRPEDYVLRKPVSAFAESIRSIRTAILYSHVDRPPRALLITSAVPDEGKSLLSIALGRSAAAAGQKVLLIDADLRRPKIGTLLKTGGEATLAEFLAGAKSDQEVLNVDPDSGMQFIWSRSGLPNPQDLLGSQRMQDFLRAIAPHYDLVLVDSPPVLAASDALVLARSVDATVFVVRWGKTPHQVVAAALKQIHSVGGVVAGGVLGRVPLKRHAKYGYADHGYYYAVYKEYVS